MTRRDLVVGPARQRSTAAVLGASVIEVDGGHAVCVTDPEALGAAVRQGVDLVVGSRGRRLRATVRRLRREGQLAPVELAPDDGAVGVAV